ncbi:MAG: hypothetical protein A2X46_03090 [Lentisphaerae bacterium GWF2_57_35]|nr:MAG: hypothetical protein A2X46_03090 [Lentisphaerae bacterium GWF2_57_35]
MPIFPVLVVSQDADPGCFLIQVQQKLQDMNQRVETVGDLKTGLDRLAAQKTYGALLLDTDLFEPGEVDAQLQEALALIRAANDPLPIFLVSGNTGFLELSSKTLAQAAGCIRKNEDTPVFIAGAVRAALEDYRDRSLPPFFRALTLYVDSCRYAWSTPGHAGGLGFLASTPGAAFHEFFGENIFRADLSSSMPELGSILEHQGPAGDAEREAARIFGADYTFFVLNGTSTANKMVWHSLVAPGDIVLVDRNCHKSIMHAIVMIGAIPAYLTPTRNAYGIIGTIPLNSFTPSEIAAAINRSARAKAAQGGRKPRVVVITNSTYDGLCYSVVGIKDLVSAGVDNLHFDEAWYGYARFHPLYAGRFGMSTEGESARHPPTFATQSSHKLLAAFSQGSMIHIRNGGQAKVDPERFNEAFLMHESTSPFYPMFASLDVTARMMAGESGRRIMDQLLGQAIAFRQKMAAIADETPKNDWWFRLWQPEQVGPTPFAQADAKLLMTDPESWVLKDGDRWHGFSQYGRNKTMLDPIKVTLLTPGIDAQGVMTDDGIPAGIVSEFLRENSVIPEKTGHYNILFLFAPGVTEGKAGVLLTKLLEFKRLHDSNAPLRDVLPELVAQNPGKYDEVGLRDLCRDMHGYLRKNKLTDVMMKVYQDIPAQVLTPTEAYASLVHGQVEYVAVRDLPGRIPAVMVVPYPPGIPVIMPGEQFGAADSPMLEYLRLCEEFDNRFPGFETEIHGVDLAKENGRRIYRIDCVRAPVAASAH